MKDGTLTPKNIKYGQLVEVASLTGDKANPYNFSHGYHSGMKVHFFNKKGVLLGNLYEFVKYDRIRFRTDGYVFERHFMNKKDGSYRNWIVEFILMALYKVKCEIITLLMRKTQYL